jgi:DNA-binding MarR family transcriptional regulator
MSSAQEGAPDGRVPNLLAALSMLIDDTLRQSEASNTSLGSSDAAALVSIGHRPGLSIEALRTTLGLTHSGTVRLIDRLEAVGKVVRRRTGSRSVQLWLTPSGQRAVSSIDKIRVDAVSALLPALSEAETRCLDSALARILAAQAHDDADLYRICRMCDFDACRTEHPCPVDAAVSG